MVSVESVNEQLKKLGFNIKAFSNRAELHELPNILIPDEEIFECVNGFYEGGAALLVATNIRVLLIDKKPLNFLTVEDLRYDMINQMDYSHRLFGAHITISVGNKNLNFRSYNKTRLRKLINHVQHCIADLKKQQSEHQEGQNQHLEQINQQLQAYLVAQYQNQMMLNQKLQDAHTVAPDNNQPPASQIVQPSPELADYLFAQSLLRQHEQQGSSSQQAQTVPVQQPVAQKPEEKQEQTIHLSNRHVLPKVSDLYEAGRREVFSKYLANKTAPSLINNSTQSEEQASKETTSEHIHGFEINPLRIAYAKLPMALRNRRRLGRYQQIGNPQTLPISPAQQ
jgi:hypothetical protein